MAIKNLIQLRKGSSSEWSSVNPVLASGEPGYDLTNNIIKIGDGATPWNNLSGIGSTVVSSSGSVDLDTTLLAGTGIVFSYDSSNNSLSINVSGQLGLTTEEVDDRINSLLNPGYGISLSYNDNANNLTISTSGLQPSGNYSLVGHSHTISDITNLQNSLDSKQPSGSYANSSHTHTASDISDSTTAGRALLTAADASAQRTSLGLGSLATQNGTFSGTSSGTNTGDQTISISGDVTAAGSTSSLNATVTKINGVALSGLSTGLLKNTTGTGAPTIAVAGTDYAAASHTHTASNITDFNSSVSGLLPVTNIVAGTNITTSNSSGSRTISVSSSLTDTIFHPFLLGGM